MYSNSNLGKRLHQSKTTQSLTSSNSAQMDLTDFELLVTTDIKQFLHNNFGGGIDQKFFLASRVNYKIVMCNDCQKVVSPSAVCCN